MIMIKQAKRLVTPQHLRIIATCRDCRQTVILPSYNLNRMVGKPVVCDECYIGFEKVTHGKRI